MWCGMFWMPLPSRSHIRANVYAGQGTAFVAERSTRRALPTTARNLKACCTEQMFSGIPHEQIIHKLDQSAQVFRILIIKTDMTIPYTSVFFELDCGYWNADAEQRLREAIAARIRNRRNPTQARKIATALLSDKKKGYSQWH